MQRGSLIPLTFEDDLAVYIESYLDDLVLADKAPKTISSYRGYLTRFAWWLREVGGPSRVERITAIHTRQFLSYLQKEDERWGKDDFRVRGVASPNTVKLYHASLRAWFNWLVSQEFIKQSPMEKVPAPKLRRLPSDPFNEVELARIAKALKEGAHLKRENETLALRDRALVATLLDTGLRCSELAALDTNHIHMVTGEVLVLSGKGRKQRRVRLGAAARRAVRRYWTYYRYDVGDVETAMFLAVTGRRLTDVGVRRMCQKLGKVAGVEDLHPHRFRHTFAVNAVRSGMPLFTLQVMLGHESLEMVRHYSQIADADVMQAMAEHSPLDRLDLRL